MRSVPYRFYAGCAPGGVYIPQLKLRPAEGENKARIEKAAEIYKKMFDNLTEAISYEKTTSVFNDNIIYANPVWDEKERRDLVKALKENKDLEKQVRVIISEILSNRKL